MLVKILTGDKRGQFCHVPREQTIDLLITLGLIEPAAPPQPTIAHPPKGWRVERRGTYNDKVVLVQHDGHGGTMVYEKVPGPQRAWKFDPETGAEGYFGVVPCDIPQSVLDEWKALGGDVPKDAFADADAGDLYRQKIARQQFEQDEQNKKVHEVLHGRTL